MELPPYDSKEILKNKLELTILEWYEGFFIG